VIRYRAFPSLTGTASDAAAEEAVVEAVDAAEVEAVPQVVAPTRP
jgi:hypothetical protein